MSANCSYSNKESAYLQRFSVKRNPHGEGQTPTPIQKLTHSFSMAEQRRYLMMFLDMVVGRVMERPRGKFRKCVKDVTDDEVDDDDGKAMSIALTQISAPVELVPF